MTQFYNAVIKADDLRKGHMFVTWILNTETIDLPAPRRIVNIKVNHVTDELTIVFADEGKLLLQPEQLVIVEVMA